jgi:hypothetical protein
MFSLPPLAQTLSAVAAAFPKMKPKGDTLPVVRKEETPVPEVPFLSFGVCIICLYFLFGKFIPLSISPSLFFFLRLLPRLSPPLPFQSPPQALSQNPLRLVSLTTWKSMRRKENWHLVSSLTRLSSDSHVAGSPSPSLAVPKPASKLPPPPPTTAPATTEANRYLQKREREKDGC